MNSFIHADIFFVIATIGFCLLTILATVALVYLILLLRRLHRAAKNIETEVKSIGVEAKEFFSMALESRLFRWLFGKKKRSRKE